jgi:hypothetical protein
MTFIIAILFIACLYLYSEIELQKQLKEEYLTELVELRVKNEMSTNFSEFINKINVFWFCSDVYLEDCRNAILSLPTYLTNLFTLLGYKVIFCDEEQYIKLCNSYDMKGDCIKALGFFCPAQRVIVVHATDVAPETFWHEIGHFVDYVVGKNNRFSDSIYASKDDEELKKIFLRENSSSCKRFKDYYLNCITEFTANMFSEYFNGKLTCFEFSDICKRYLKRVEEAESKFYRYNIS